MTDNTSDIDTTPLRNPNADKPGCYEIISRTVHMVIDPGDKIAIQILFTGYGYIESPKFVFYPPTDFIKTGQVTHGIRTDSNSKGSSIHGWGAQTDTIKPTGVIMILSGLISRQNPDSIKAYRSIFLAMSSLSVENITRNC